MPADLPLKDMHLRHWGLTPAIATNNFEAAAVCLSRHHVSPTTVIIENGSLVAETNVEWDTPNARILGAWNNAIDATEMGAYACVIAAMELTKGLLAVRRAETGTGVDYYVGPPGSGQDDLENCSRLEVSGVDAGTGHDVQQRLLRKVEQARRGDSGLPAIAGVVGFAARLIAFADVGPG
jgi:hypothetical protein